MATGSQVILTFDDGPNSPYTEKILDILKEERVSATFFVCGKNAQKYPHLVKKMAKDSHLVANHSWNHQYLPSILGLNYREIADTEKLIGQLTGQKNKLYRAPWGKIPPWLKSKLESEGFKVVGWDVMADYKGIFGTAVNSEDEIVSRVQKAKDGDVIVLHDRKPAVKSLQAVISTLYEKGFSFSTNL